MTGADRMLACYFTRETIQAFRRGDLRALPDTGMSIFVEPLQPGTTEEIVGYIGRADPLRESAYHTPGGIGSYTYYQDYTAGNPGVLTFDRVIFYAIVGFMYTTERVIVRLKPTTVEPGRAGATSPPSASPAPTVRTTSPIGEGQRRLLAIVFTDIVNWTGMCKTNEAAALALKREDDAILEHLISQSKGTIVKGTGDGFIVRFDSALSATTCAVEVMTRLHDRNRGNSLMTPIHIRIGLHLADVAIQPDGDLLGAGVNLTQRIMAEAPAPGIATSQAIYDEVRDKVPFAFRALGQRDLKHIGEVPLFTIPVPTIPKDEEPPPSQPARIPQAPTTPAPPSALGNIPNVYADYLDRQAHEDAERVRSAIRNRGVRPGLSGSGWSVRLRPTRPDVEKVNIVYLRSDSRIQLASGSAMRFQLWVENTGTLREENVEIQAIGLDVLGANGEWKAREDFRPLRLCWSESQQAGKPITVLAALAPGLGAFCHLGYMVPPEIIAHGMLATPAPGKSILSLGTVGYIQLPGLGTHEAIIQGTTGEILLPGSYRIRMRIASAGGPTASFSPVLSFDGSWRESDAQLSESALTVEVG